MTVRSRFNTADNYTCEDVINEQKLLYSDNVCIKDSFKVSQSDIASMSLKVKQGTAKVKGVSIISDAQETVSIVTNSSSYARYDLVVLEIDNTTYVATLKVIEGIPSSSPLVPNLSSNQLALAKVYVSSGATSILDSNITDIRKVFNYDSIGQGLNELINNTVKENTDKVMVSPVQSNGNAHNWYIVRNGYCTVSLDIYTHYWTGNTSDVTSGVILTDLPKPIGEIHGAIPNFDEKNKPPQDFYITSEGVLNLFEMHSVNAKIRYSGTITYPVAL